MLQTDRDLTFNRFDHRSMLKTFDKSAKTTTLLEYTRNEWTLHFTVPHERTFFNVFIPGKIRVHCFTLHGDREKSTEILRISLSRVNGRVCARVYKFISKIVSAVQYQRQHLLLFQRNSLQKIDVSISHSTGRIFIHESLENCARRRLDTPRQPSYQPPRVHDKDKVF